MSERDPLCQKLIMHPFQAVIPVHSKAGIFYCIIRIKQPKIKTEKPRPFQGRSTPLSVNGTSFVDLGVSRFSTIFMLFSGLLSK